MASRSQKAKKGKRNQEELLQEPVIVKEQPAPAQVAPIEYTARFLHGSEDSKDVDCVYVVNSAEPFPTRVQLVDFCRNDQEDRNVIRLAQEHLASDEWFVRDSYRGPPDEVNNALISTHRNDPLQPSYEFLLKQKVPRCVLLRYVIASKAIIVKMRRMEECRKECIAALSSWSFDRYLDTVHRSCSKFFSKLTRGSAKYVTFHMAQSYALSVGIEVFTKSTLVALFPEIKPLIYYQGTEDDPIDTSLVSIMKKLEAAWYQQADKVSCITTDKILHLQTFYLRTNSNGSNNEEESSSNVILDNYLELDCNGTVLDMQEERLIIFPPPLYNLRSRPNHAPNLEDPIDSLAYPPTWPIDIAIDDSKVVQTKNSIWVHLSTHQSGLVVSYGEPETPLDPSSSKKPKGARNSSTGDLKARHRAASKVAADTVTRARIDLDQSWASFQIDGDGVVAKIVLRNRLSLRVREISVLTPSDE